MDERVDCADAFVRGCGDEHPPLFTVGLVPDADGLSDGVVDTRCRLETVVLLVGVQCFDTAPTQLQGGVASPWFAETLDDTETQGVAGVGGDEIAWGNRSLYFDIASRTGRHFMAYGQAPLQRDLYEAHDRAGGVLLDRCS